MEGDHRSRYCAQCELHVHNVSAMTRPEVDRLMAAANGRLCLNGFARPDGELVTQESLVELMELHGAPPERVAAVRAALAAGLTAAALSLAACSPFTGTGGSVALPPGTAAPVVEPEGEPAPVLRGEIAAPSPQAEVRPMPMVTGGSPCPDPIRK